VPDEHPTKIARQPFTFGGVARFAHATFLRLSAVAFSFGLLSGIVVSWLLATCVAQVIDESISKLPTTGSIERGALNWPEKEGRLLGANAFVSVSVAIRERDSENAPVDFTFEFRTNALMVRSFPGTALLAYPSKTEIELNRTALLPAWGAWRAPILVGFIPGTAILLFLTWSLLAVPYSIIPVVMATILGRDLTLPGAWKMGLASQLSGSLMMAFALALYSTGKISVILVLIMLPAHLVPSLCYLIISPFFLPKAVLSSSESNPFESERRPRQKGRNPFAGK
jgi:hypothetical protein